MKSRSLKEQKEKGAFYSTIFDVDKPFPLNFNTSLDVFKTMFEGYKLSAYTTSSATPDYQKHRVMMPLKTPITGRDYPYLMQILNNKIESKGIVLDRCNERYNQIFYLPNKSKSYVCEEKGETAYIPLSKFEGKTKEKIFKQVSDYISSIQCIPLTIEPDTLIEFIQSLKTQEYYDYYISDIGNYFDWTPLQSEIDDLRAKAEEVRAVSHAGRVLRIKERIIALQGKILPIDTFNQSYPAEDLLSRYGYEKWDGGKWLSPNSESGNAGVELLNNNRWLSYHISDVDLKIGKPSDNNKVSGSAFDLYKFYEHGNDEKAAVKAVADLLKTPEGKTITEHNQDLYREEKHKEHLKETVSHTGMVILSAEQPTPEALKAKAKQILDSQEPCGEFDINILPDTWKNYIKAAMAETAADPMMIVQSLICSISAMVGTKIYIPNGVSFGDLYPNLWCCSISDSGTFKTTALNKGSRIARRKEKKISQQISDLETQREKLTGKDSKDSKELINKQIKECEKQSPYLSDKATAAALYSMFKFLKLAQC